MDLSNNQTYIVLDPKNYYVVSSNYVVLLVEPFLQALFNLLGQEETGGGKKDSNSQGMKDLV